MFLEVPLRNRFIMGGRGLRPISFGNGQNRNKGESLAPVAELKRELWEWPEVCHTSNLLFRCRWGTNISNCRRAGMKTRHVCGGSKKHKGTSTRTRYKYSLVQWNWFSDVTGCMKFRCIQCRQRTNFTAQGCMNVVREWGPQGVGARLKPITFGNEFTR